MDRLTVRMDEDAKRQLDLLAAKRGTVPAVMARELIERGVMEDAQRVWAPLVRQAIRDEFDSFLESERIQREFSADELYGRLATELRMDLDDIRVLVGAVLADSLGRDGATGDESERLASALQQGLWMGFEGVRGAYVREEDEDENV